MVTRPGYVVLEPGDENLSPTMLDWRYHVSFEGAAFPGPAESRPRVAG
jgi:hypothetical protein